MKLHQVLESAPESSSAEYVAERVRAAGQSLSTSGLQGIETLYTRDVHFEDPVLALQGRKAVMSYFARKFLNLDSCSLKFHQMLTGDTDIYLSWKLFVSHPRLKGGSTIRVEGASYLRTRNGKIYYQRNFFDLGEFLYENMPILGSIVKKVKRRIA